jgi:hypothetical protein
MFFQKNSNIYCRDQDAHNTTINVVNPLPELFGLVGTNLAFSTVK